MNPRILVTGGSGLLGSYILRYLRHSGYTQLTATYQNNPDRIPEDLRDGIEWKSMIMPDMIAAYDMVEGQDWVIHAAGLISYDAGDKYNLLRINQEGTKHIVNACLEHEVRHLIYVGCIAALGKEKNFVTLNESSPWLQNEFSTNYGLSKYLGEVEVWRGLSEGLNISVILPSLIMGAGDWHRSSLQIIDRVAHSPGWYPTGQTGYVDVRDVVRFIKILLEQNHSGERWLLSGSNMTFGDMFHLIAKHLGIHKTFRPAPKWLAGVILNAGSLVKGKRLGTEVLHHVYGTFSYDASKSLGVEGFTYRPIEETIREVTESYNLGLNQKFLQF